jgi:uncharacterized protein (DUF1800 family)
MSNLLPSDLSKVDPQQAWQPWVPDDQQPWDAKWVAHFYRRAGFGGSVAEIEQAVKEGFPATLERLLNGSPQAQQRLDLLEWVAESFDQAEALSSMQCWWIYLMLHGGHPLREKMTLFWHNHFATSIAKVHRASLMHRQNQLVRKHALGRFGPFLHEMSRDVAMLIWLDSNENVKAHPNENFAREVMELFSLGVGNYKEKDIQEAARAFTGWHTDSTQDAFEFTKDAHDYEEKTVLGQRGKWDGDDVLTILLKQPATANFLVGKLYRDFVSETPPPKGLLDPLREQFRKSDYDTTSLMKTLLGSRLFFSEHAFLKRVKNPVEFVLGAIHSAWPGSAAPSALIEPLQRMGQNLFAPPNVKGWVGGKTWLNNATLLARNNFAEDVAMGRGFTRAVSYPNFAKEVEAVATELDKSPKGTGKEQAELPPPPIDFDLVKRFDLKKASDAALLINRLGELFLPGYLPERAKSKLQAYLSDGKPTGAKLDTRIREAAHAVMCMPEYQLC